jgi:hypothetical protein
MVFMRATAAGQRLLTSKTSYKITVLQQDRTDTRQAPGNGVLSGFAKPASSARQRG